MQHRALLDTLVLTESGARLELLEPDTQVRPGKVEAHVRDTFKQADSLLDDAGGAQSGTAPLSFPKGAEEWGEFPSDRAHMFLL